ncbi:MAG: hypothetical protein EHM39_06405 [Chloroflexi bacterium]|nr:MAG: hypothetical protein EHM39_06405 [Chloroflexota bacterium]
MIGSFDNPLRRLIHRPERILAGLVREGQTMLDVGPGMGYFTLPLAKLVGEGGINSRTNAFICSDNFASST